MQEPIRIMIVDDHPVVLWGLTKLIEGQAPRLQLVAQVATAEQALTAARRERPALVLLDLRLGSIDGIAIIPELVALGCRVLVITCAEELATHEQAALAGAAGVILKGQPAEVILKAIYKVHAGEVWLDRATTARIMNRFARRSISTIRPPDPVADLTPKERQVVDALVKSAGAPNKSIASRLAISEHTLRNHLSSVYSKLGVGSRFELFLLLSKAEEGGS
jgi:two-component system, NarL family, nitrate/nitrite response regulator NarL